LYGAFRHLPEDHVLHVLGKVVEPGVVDGGWVLMKVDRGMSIRREHPTVYQIHKCFCIPEDRGLNQIEPFGPLGEGLPFSLSYR
jgi:hypothetical protein